MALKIAVFAALGLLVFWLTYGVWIRLMEDRSEEKEDPRLK